MKKISILAVLLSVLTTGTIYSQSVGINNNGSNPNSSAMLDVSSTTTGMLIPRMTSAQKSAINPLPEAAQGMVIYQTDGEQGFYYNTSTTTTPNWVKLYAGTGDAWDIQGNAGTADGTNFLGTTDNVPLNFIVNNQEAGRIGISGDASTFFGYQAGLNDDHSDNRNTFIGFHSGYSNTTGSGNTANGMFALYANTTGDNNTADGYRALNANTTGYRNTANGFYALCFNTTGNRNTANGYQALNSNTMGSANTANGHQALLHNTTGLYNTANGCYVLYTNTTGGYNTALGYYALYFGNNYSNSTALGYYAQPGASNTVRVGNSSVTTIGGFANWTNVSDGRFKTNIKENVAGLDFIMKLRPVTYQLDMDAIASFNKTPDSLRLTESEKLKAAEIQIGFITQEVEQAAQSLGFDFHGVDKPKNATSHYGLRYAEFVMPLVKATQEQQAIIKELKQENEQLKKQNEKILMRLTKLEKKMN